MMNILILGSNGFLGSLLREHLPFKIFVLKKKDTKSATYSKHAILKSIRSNEINVVINCCGSYSNNYELDYSANVQVTLNVFEAIARQDKEVKVILFGSAAEYGVKSNNPISEETVCMPKTIYGITKYLQYLISNHYRKNTHINVVYLRLFNIHGNSAPNTLVTGKLLQYIKDGETELRFGSLSAQRDYIMTDEFVQIIKLFCEVEHNDFLYNIGQGKPIVVRQMLLKILEQYNVSDFNLIEQKGDSSDDIIYPCIKKFIKLKEEYYERTQAR